MRFVKLDIETLLVEDVSYDKGDVLCLADTKANEVVACGAGHYVKETASYANKGVSLLGDVVSPEPPVFQVVNPADGLAPSVTQNPGLADLVTATGKVGEVPDSGTAAGIVPARTGTEGDATESESVKTDGTVEGTDPGSQVSAGPNAPEISTATRRPGTRNASRVTGRAE